MNKDKIKSLSLHALKVFIRTFISSIIVHLANVNFIDDKEFKNKLIGIAISAGAASFYAVWETVLSPLFKSDS